MKIIIEGIKDSPRWLECTASLIHSKRVTETEHSLKDQLLHEVSILRLREVFFNENHEKRIRTIKKMGLTSKLDHTLHAKWDANCEKTLKEFVSHSANLYEKYKPDTIEINKKIQLNWYGFVGDVTIDLLMFSSDYTVIVDLKVDEINVGNKEINYMLMYAVGIVQMESINKTGFLGSYIISVYQHLVGNIGTHNYSLNQIARFYASNHQKMEEIISNRLEYDPSPMACKFCDYKNDCREKIHKESLTIK